MLCVQGFGKLEVKPAALGIDLMTVSSHKIHGPKGAGALYIRRGVRVKPRVFGGGQEKDLRPGTEAMPALVGFGAACAALPEVKAGLAHATELRGYLLEQIGGLRGITLNSPPDALPYIVNLSIRAGAQPPLGDGGICIKRLRMCERAQKPGAHGARLAGYAHRQRAAHQLFPLYNPTGN